MVGNLITNLKEIIQRQNEIIESTRQEIREIRSEQQTLQDKNGDLLKEVHDLRAQIEAQAASPQPKSWAAVATEAACGEAPSPGTPTPKGTELHSDQHGTSNRRHRQWKSRSVYQILADRGCQHTYPLCTAARRNHQKHEVAGIGTTKTGYVIRFRDEQSATTARDNPEWLEELGNETKLVKPRFGVVVHRVPTGDFDLDRNKRDGIDKIMQENDLADKGYQIEDVAWLKRKDIPLGRSATLGIWLNTPEAAEFVLTNGLLVGQRYIGSVELYRVEQKRCRRCQRFGHLAWSCKERVRCGHCAGQHDQRHCFPGV